MPAAIEAVTSTADWLTHLYTDCEGWLTLFSVDRNTGEQHIDWAPADQPHLLAAIADERASTCCVWFGVATRTHRLEGWKRGGAADCLHIPGLWADLDIEGPNHKGGYQLPPTIEAAKQLLDDFPLRPSAVVKSGGGLQPWWLFQEPLAVAEATDLLRGWGATWAELGRRRGWHVDNVFDAARIMRLPGTTNRKGSPQPVTAKVDWSRRYQPSDFEPHLLEPPPAPEPGRIPYIGPERPGDAFNAVRRGGDILAAAGFTFARRSGDEDHWTHPWKTPKEGTSATVYPDGHTTLWSDTIVAHWPHVQLRRPYDPFGLYTVLFHNGDFSAAREALVAQGYGTRARADDDFSWVQLNPVPAGTPEEGDSLGIQPICWTEFWQREHNGEDWLIEPIVPRGRQVALWAVHKTGKSLITLEMAAAAATGTTRLGETPTDPIDVVYLDMEMTEDDLHDRLLDLGYSPDTDLTHLHYYLLPALPPLDTPAGSAMLLELVARHQAQLLIIDTMARVVAGEENSADTYRAFYRHTGLHLKARGVSVLRLDHGGKDPTQGQRGSSAKGDDVDIVWQLRATDTGLQLTRKAARMSWVPEKVSLRRHEEPTLRHTIDDELNWPAGTAATAVALDELGLPLTIPYRKAGSELRKAGYTASNAVLRSALKYRRRNANRTDSLLGSQNGCAAPAPQQKGRSEA